MRGLGGRPAQGPGRERGPGATGQGWGSAALTILGPLLLRLLRLLRPPRPGAGLGSGGGRTRGGPGSPLRQDPHPSSPLPPPAPSLRARAPPLPAPRPRPSSPGPSERPRCPASPLPGLENKLATRGEKEQMTLGVRVSLRHSQAARPLPPPLPSEREAALGVEARPGGGEAEEAGRARRPGLSSRLP